MGSQVEPSTGGLTAPVDAADIADGSVSSTEFQYLDGVTSDLQTQLASKVDISGTPNAGEYARWSDADTLEARTTAQVLSDIGAQASDADLTAIAALTSAADKVPYATGAGTWSLADLTAAGRALLDDADAAAQLVTLGVAAAITGTKLDDLTAPDDNTDLNASSTRHGLLPKLSNVATEFLNGVGAWATPAGGYSDYCAAYKNASQTITAQTWTAVSWPAETVDSGTVHDNATNNSRITIATTGKYLIHADMSRLSVTTDALLKIYVNGSAVNTAGTGNHYGYLAPHITALLSLTAGDYVQVYIWTYAGADINYDVSSTGANVYLHSVPHIICVRVG